MDNYRDRVTAALMHAIAGGALGYYSPIIRAEYGLFAVFMLAAMSLIIIFQYVKFVMKNTEFSWWMGNGIWAFVSTWFAIWLFVMNV